jgi:hypothetical protein
MEYNPHHRWQADSCFGASLSSLCRLGQQKGYSLVACTLAGTNAFFVRDDLVGQGAFAEPFTAAAHYQPARFFLVKESAGHVRGFGPGRAH